jgi:hypothetical protein
MPGGPVARRFSCHRPRARIGHKRPRRYIPHDGHVFGTLRENRDRLRGPLIEEQHASVAFAEVDVTVNAGVPRPVRVDGSDVIVVMPVVATQVDVNGGKHQTCEERRGAKDRDKTAKHRRHYAG